MHLKFLLSFLSLFLLAACGASTSVDRAVELVKNIPNGASSKSEGYFKVGSPYKVLGKHYTPRETYNYSETGIASWYGPNFHGKKTANGEVFDMNEITAAHKTLQIPSIVRVTNLENGRSLIVRVNDRGPFKRGRVIDLSRRSAELLGMKNKGTAKVKLQLLSQESRAVALAAKRGEDTSGVEIAMNEYPTRSQRLERQEKDHSNQEPSPLLQDTRLTLQASDISSTPPLVERQALAPSVKKTPLKTNILIKQMPVSPSGIYVQAGSFSNSANARKLALALKDFGQARVYPTIVNGQDFYRVRIGPIGDVSQADGVLTQLASAGRNDTMIIVD